MEFKLLTLQFGKDYLIVLLQQVCVVTTLVFVGFRSNWLRGALDSANVRWSKRLVLILLLGLVAIFDDLTGLVINVKTQEIAPHQIGQALNPGEAIIDLRDMITAAAGLIGGFPIGIGVGLLAGAGRIAMGGDYGLAAGLATVLIGVVSAWCHYRFPRVGLSPPLALAFGLAITGLQRVVIVLIAYFHQLVPWAELLTLIDVITLPKALTNATGCCLFAWLREVVESDRQMAEKDRALAESHRDLAAAMLGSYLGQVQPHFLGNALNSAVGMLANQADRPPSRENIDRAKRFLAELAAFFVETLHVTDKRSIRLEQELMRLRSYIGLQEVLYGERMEFRADLGAEIMDWPLPPNTLLTLVENAFSHGFRDRRVSIAVLAEPVADRLRIRVRDRGHGFSPETLEDLGRCQVKSTAPSGTGTGLFRLGQILQLVYQQDNLLAFANYDGGAESTVSLPRSFDHEP